MSALYGYDHLFKLLVVGDLKTGKSSLIHRYTHNIFNQQHLVLNDFATNTCTVDGKIIKLQIWDTPTQFNQNPLYASITSREVNLPTSIRSQYYRGTNGIIIVYDITNKESFDNIKTWLDEYNRYAKFGTPIILVGTKVDLCAERKVSLDDVEQFIKTYSDPDNKIQHIETSAKTGANISSEVNPSGINDVFTTMSKTIMAQNKNTREYNPLDYDGHRDNKPTLTLNLYCSIM
jgi:Ras-related protein Rab-1A